MKKGKNNYHLCLKTKRPHIHKSSWYTEQSAVVPGLHLGEELWWQERKVIYFLLIIFLSIFLKCLHFLAVDVSFVLKLIINNTF